MTLLAITVIGHDRPGIIAETTGQLAALGLNLEDSSMTLLRGHFAMTLICAGDASAAAAEQALGALASDGALTVTVREVPGEHVEQVAGSAWVLTVHGGDRAGIVSRVAHEIATVGGNITDLTTRLSGDLYLLVAELDLPADADVPALESALRAAAQQLGVGVTLREAEADEL